MIVRIYNPETGDSYKIKASMAVVEDDFGNPIGVACEVAKNVTCVAHHNDEDFHRVLRHLGIDKTVFVEPIVLKDLKKQSLAAL